MNEPPPLPALTPVRCVCETCGFTVMAMTIGALVDAKKAHEAYARWLADMPAAVVPPLLP